MLSCPPKLTDNIPDGQLAACQIDSVDKGFWFGVTVQRLTDVGMVWIGRSKRASAEFAETIRGSILDLGRVRRSMVFWSSGARAAVISGHESNVSNPIILTHDFAL